MAILSQIAVLKEVTGAPLDEHRMAAIAEVLLDHGFTEAQLVEATERLKVDQEFNRKLSFGRPVTAADFVGVVDGPYSRTKLLTWHQALAECQKTGEQFGPDAWVKVPVKGQKPLWRRRNDR